MKRSFRATWFFLSSLVALTPAIACETNDGIAQAATAIAVDTSSASTQQAQVTRIVFVGKKKACDCTRTRVDETWKVLREVLGQPAKMPVERLQIDTEPEKVEPYRKQRPILTLPALYFLNSKDKLVELLQGEVTPKQVRHAIGMD